MAWAQRSNRAAPSDWKQRRAAVLARDGHRCYLCGGQATEVDHIVNVTAGGSHELHNLAAICAPCHKTKTQAESVAARPRLRRDPEKHPGLR